MSTKAGRLTILGAQESGVGAAVLAKQHGYTVFVSDAGAIRAAYRDELVKHAIDFEEGGHTLSRVLAADEVVKSPGIPDRAAVVQAIREQGIPVISEIELAFRYAEGSTIIGITGSNGKTTTTMLLHHILSAAGIDAGLCGNVGRSFAALVAERQHAVYVVELSSFQLDGIVAFRPDIALLMNITPDHMDRYDHRMANYVASKFRIAMNQRPQDHFVYCADDDATRQGLALHPVRAQRWPFSIRTILEHGGYMHQEQIHIATPNAPFTMSILDLALQGKHNVYNSMAAGIAARILEVRKESIRESLSDFQNVEHRLERVAKVNDVEFINDSKATNVNSTWYALESMNTATIWIVGGEDKGNDYSQLRELVRQKVKAIVCLGKDNAKIHQAFGDLVQHIEDTTSAHEAVQAAYRISENGDTVLLSPACASFDLFRNYEDRGQQFKAAVRAL